MKCGIYAIVNNANGKRYVGQSRNIKKRWSNHLDGLRSNCHWNSHLQSAWNKHGERSFVFEVLVECEVDDLSRLEQLFIDERSEYNLCKVAGSKYGYKMSEEAKSKISSFRTGRKASKETKIKMSESHKGRVFSAETRMKKSKALLGKRPSQESRKKMSESHKELWRIKSVVGKALGVNQNTVTNKMIEKFLEGENL